MQCFEHIRADNKMQFVNAVIQPHQRIRHVAYAAAANLIIARNKPFLARKRGTGKLKPFFCIHAKSDAFMRRIARHHKQHPVKRETPPDLARNINMSVVRGIKAAPQYTDSH